MDTKAPSNAPEITAIVRHLTRDLIGHERLIDRLLQAFLASGHVLIEGAPGLGKTRAVKSLAQALDSRFARIQCTPDLMPADITGTQIFLPQEGTTRFEPGPIFHSLVLVDEVNRAPPKVQSAMLEAMAERQVTIGRKSHSLPDPFMLVATQNPFEHEGTFPLPEAQLDRFLFHVSLGLPEAEDELKILNLVESETIERKPEQDRIPIDALMAIRARAMRVYLSPELKDYIVRLVMATRVGPIAEHIEHAVSPRGSLALAATAKARAYLNGRDYALPEDVEDLAADTLSHRFVLRWRAVAEGRTNRAVVADILKEVEPL